VARSSAGVVTGRSLAGGGRLGLGARLVVRGRQPAGERTVITDGTYSIDSFETAPVSGSAITTR